MKCAFLKSSFVKSCGPKSHTLWSLMPLQISQHALVHFEKQRFVIISGGVSVFSCEVLRHLRFVWHLEVKFCDVSWCQLPSPQQISHHVLVHSQWHCLYEISNRLLVSPCKDNASHSLFICKKAPSCSLSWASDRKQVKLYKLLSFTLLCEHRFLGPKRSQLSYL